MKIMITLLSLVLLASCTSKPLMVKYYLLHTPDNKILNTRVQTKPIVILQMVDVAEYLNQSGLVMQIDKYELYYSRQDVWAEKLQSAFYKALLKDLNAAGLRTYVVYNSPSAVFASSSIKVELAHFHATDTSNVVSSGRYWLSLNNPQTAENEQPFTSSHAFFFESELKQDGYAHAVEKLRTLINNLAKQIEKDIAALPNN
ncbi:MAG: putative lipoprotein YmbA [Arenicella sp.]|jgi:uncharacterized lipoprotein YmbA